MVVPILFQFFFLVLGLPEKHQFWVEYPKPWTSQNAWSGKPFPIDTLIK